MRKLLRNPLATVTLVLTMLVSSYIFYALNSGITITNDGSHFALFDALVTTGNPELKHVKQFAFNDSALYEGKYYADRNPGLALLSYAFYQGVRPLETWMHPLNLDPKMARRYRPEQESRVKIVMLVPVLSGSLLLLGMIALGVNQGNALATAVIAAVTLMAGTVLMRYSTLLYSHVTAAALLIWGLLLIFRFRTHGRSLDVITGTFLLSLAVLVEHLLILAFIPVFTYLLLYCRSRLLSPKTLAMTITAGLLPMLALMVYNWVCFESPFSLAHFHHSTDTANHQLGSLFKFENQGKVLQNLFFGAPKEEVGRQDLTGLISASPFLIIILLPLINRLLKKEWPKAEIVTLASVIALIVLGASSFHSPYGGWDRDYRYFVVIVPLFAPFVAQALTLMFKPAENTIIRVAQWLLLVIFSYLAWLSISFHFQHIRHAMQVQYETPWINLQAALVNVSLFWLYLAALTSMLVVLVKATRRPTKNKL
ncbi:MAG: hypothetical protein V7720_11940 [Halioglobus sp.]